MLEDTQVPILGSGSYNGFISGYKVEFKVGSCLYEAYFDNGLRGINIPTVVYVSETGTVTCFKLSGIATKVVKVS